MKRTLDLNVISLTIETKQNGFLIEFNHPDNCCELVASTKEDLFAMLEEIFFDKEWEAKYESIRFTNDTDERFLKER